MNELKIVKSNETGLMDMKQAAGYLNIKRSTLYQKTMRKEIVYVKIGKLNRFKKSDLDEFVNRNTIGGLN